MYSPRPRIRHPLPVLTEPTREDAMRSRLFSPLRLRSGLELHERSWIPAMVPWRASPEGEVTPEVLAWYERFALAQPGAIVIEATGIRDVPSGPLLRAGHDRFLPGLTELVGVVRRASQGRTRLFVQLIDFLRVRRRPARAKYFERFLGPSDAHRARLSELRGDDRWLRAADAELRVELAAANDAELETLLDRRELESLRYGDRERVTDTFDASIGDLPRTLPPLFVDAAERAARAGFDGVELHYAHAYTMASFLSATNTREDGYGTTLEGRLRLPLEVLAEVRRRVGRTFTVGARILCDEIIEGGSSVSDAAHFGVELARAGLDFLSLSTGGKFDDAKQPKEGEAVYPYTGRSGFECMPPALSDERGPYGRNVAKQARVRAAIRAAGFETPVVVAGGIGDFALAEAILERGEGDLIGAARQSLADPDWWRKLREGRASEIRRCIYSNYCEGLDQKHRAVSCQLWDRERLDEPDAQLTDGGRRRLVAPL